MNTLNSKLPAIDYDKYTFYNHKESNTDKKKRVVKKKYLDEILEKKFLKKYFNLNDNKIE